MESPDSTNPNHRQTGDLAEAPDCDDETFSVRLNLVSADEIRRWSSGAVKTHRILTRDKQGLHPNGLFSEQIFGPDRDRKLPSATQALRMGHIELPFPVFHPLFRRGVAGRAVRTLLGISATDQNQLLKGSTVIVTDPGDSGMEMGSLITALQYESQGEQPGPRSRFNQKYVHFEKW